jgi:protein-tyrosine kinase
VSRVFDALKKVNPRAVSLPMSSPDMLVDTLEKGFSPELLATAKMQLGPDSRLMFHTDPHGLGAERYRLLRLRLKAVRVGAQIKTLLITSPGPREGKSICTLNLAAALAEKQDQSVLVLEGDLRRPSLAQELGLQLPSGLTQSPRNDIGLQSAIWKIDPLGFYLLPAGKPINNPAEILNSEWFAETKQKLASVFDWILIDSPPVIPIVDTVSLKDHADASLLVVRAGRTQQTSISEAMRVLGADHILGILLNGVEGFDRGYYEYASGK